MTYQNPEVPMPLPGGFPSVFDLGRHVQILLDASERLDGSAEPGSKEVAAAMFLAQDRECAIRDLMTTMRAVTLQDAAAQLCAGFYVLAGIEALEMSRHRRKAELTKLRRVILSVTQIVAREARVDLWTIGGGEVDRLEDREFVGLVATLANAAAP